MNAKIQKDKIKSGDSVSRSSKIIGWDCDTDSKQALLISWTIQNKLTCGCSYPGCMEICYKMIKVEPVANEPNQAETVDKN